MRSESAPALFIVLLIVAPCSRAAPGAWFAASPCGEGAQVVPLTASRALLRVHTHAGDAGHDALLQQGSDGVWRTPLEEWHGWTSAPPPSVETDAAGHQLVPLQASAAIAVRYDPCASELWVDADPSHLDARDLTRPIDVPVTPAGYGGFANVDAEHGGLLGSGHTVTTFDTGVFLPGVSERTGFFTANHRVRRLDSTAFVDQPSTATRLTVGDAVSRAAEWEAPVRFAGLQWGRDFSLQPERITFPLPSLSGNVALPSSAELFVNGVQQGQQAMQPGRFRLDSIPVLTGAGDLSVVVRDALGREQTIVQPFYTSPRLLTPGLTANTFEEGVLRADYAGDNDRYTEPFAGVTLARGFTEDFTASARGVATRRRQLAGAEGDWVISNVGLLSGSSALSHTQAGWGGIATLAFEHVSDRWSVTLRRRFATRAYGEIGREPGTLRLSDAARLGLNLPGAGAVSALYVSEQPWTGGGARFAGLSYSAQVVSRVQFYASWLHTLGHGGESVVAGLSVLVGSGTTAGADYSAAGGHAGIRGYAGHSPAGPLGPSWWASADSRDQGLREARADWSGTHGTLGAGYAALGDHGAPEVYARSGLVYADDALFWTRPIQSSFAVVDTAPAAHVSVLRENLPVGQTGSDGRLLVPDLLPFQANHLSIDARDLPMTMALGTADVRVVPPFGAGVPVRFAVDANTVYRLRLVDAMGAAVRAGALLRVDGRELDLPVGYDGAVYAQLDLGRHRLDAAWPGGGCRATLTVTAREAVVGSCSAVRP